MQITPFHGLLFIILAAALTAAAVYLVRSRRSRKPAEPANPIPPTTQAKPHVIKKWETHNALRMSYKPVSVLAPVVANEPASIQKTLRVYAAKLVEKFPRNMTVGRREQLEARLGIELTPHLVMGLYGSGPIQLHDLPAVETMALDLYSPDAAFSIEACSAREQLITKDILQGTPLADGSQPYGRWLWNVTPPAIRRTHACPTCHRPRPRQRWEPNVSNHSRPHHSNLSESQP